MVVSIAPHLFEPCTEAEFAANLGICQPWWGYCWCVLLMQLSLGIALLVYVNVRPDSWKTFSRPASNNNERFTQLINDHDDPEERAVAARTSYIAARRQTVFFSTRSGKIPEDTLTTAEKSMSDAYRKFVIALRSEPCFCKHRRELSNFVRSNTDPLIQRPPQYPTERYVNNLNRIDMYRYLFLFQLRDVFKRTVAFGLLVSSVSTALHLLLERERFDALGVEPVFATFLAAARTTIGDAQDNFKFYPIFLLQGYVGYAVVRWREFVKIGYSIQGRIHDVALICGGAIANPHERASRELAFKLYRYLNLAHFLCYQSKHEWLRRLAADQTCVRLGLLTEAEAKVLSPMANKMRDTVLGWLSSEIQAGVASGQLHATCTPTALDQLSLLRGQMAAFHDQVRHLHISSTAPCLACLLLTASRSFSLLLAPSRSFSLMSCHVHAAFPPSVCHQPAGPVGGTHDLHG